VPLALKVDQLTLRSAAGGPKGPSQKVTMSDLEQLSDTTESAAPEAVEPSSSPVQSNESESSTDETGLLGSTESDDDEIEAAGEKYRVPKKLSAHLRELEQAGLRQDDYTRKTQSVAEEKRAIESERQQLVAQKQFQQQHVQAVAKVMAIDEQLAKYQALDWNGLTDADPVQAMKLERQMRELQTQRTQIVGGIEQTSQQQAYAQQQATARQRQESVAQLQRDIKGFGTPEVAKELFETGTKYGIKENEWANLDDPRLYKLIDIARKYDKLVSQKTTEARPTVAEVKPITRVTPGAGTNRRSLSDPGLSMADFVKLRQEQTRRR